MVVEALAALRAAADDGRLDVLCASLGVRVLTVFGSALDDPVTAGDLDVAVSLEDGADVLGVADALTGLVGSDLVDVLVLEGASPTARRNALSGVLALHESEEGLFARTQVAAVGEFLDTAWMRRDALVRMAGR